MAYSMIALTTAGTTFACASVSLTETGLAVLDESGSRIGFVPYDSLEYVAPTEESRVSDAPMRILTEDGSSFGAASISQAAAGVAVLDESGARIGFVPYDTLTYVLPESKTGPTLPADATPVDGVDIAEEDDGGSPVWEGDEERSDEHGEDAGTQPDDASDDDSGTDDSDQNVDRSGNDNDSDPHPSPDEGDENAETDDEATDETDDETDEDENDEGVWDDEPAEESDRDDGAEGEESGADSDGQGDETTGTDDEAADETTDEPAENGEREEAEESELVVEWSFGDDE